MTLHRILLATLACAPAAEAFHVVPPVPAATGPPAHRLLAGRSPATQSIASASFQQQQRQRQRSPPPQRACLGDNNSDTSSSALSRRTTASISTTTPSTTAAARTTAITALSLCNNPSASVASGQEEDLLLGGEANGGADGPKSSSTSTLGIAHSVLERTIVPALYGAVLKQSPSDFVVVEIPLYAGSKFTPSDVNAPIPEPVRKPVVRKV